MPAFRIHARNLATDEPSIETISAASQAAAWEATSKAGIFVSRIEELAAATPTGKELTRLLVQVPFLARFAGQRQSLSRARAIVYRALQRAAELGSGPTQSLAHLKDRTGNIEMDDAIPGLLDKKYLTIVEALAAYPAIFPARDVALIRAHKDDAKNLAAVYRDLIERSLIEQTQHRQAFSERMDAYLTYAAIVFVTIVLLPVIAAETAQGNAAYGVNLTHNPMYEAMQAFTYAALLLRTWWFDAGLLLGGAAIIQFGQRYINASDERAAAVEQIIWKVMPQFEDATLDMARIDAIEQLAHANLAGINEHHAALENAIAASSSATFRLMLRRLYNRPSSQPLGNAIAREPLWGSEIQSYFAALTGDANTAKTTWGTDILELCQQLRQDEAANRNIRRLSIGMIHVGVGFAVSMGLTLLMTFIPIMQAIAISAK